MNPINVIATCMVALLVAMICLNLVRDRISDQAYTLVYGGIFIVLFGMASVLAVEGGSMMRVDRLVIQDLVEQLVEKKGSSFTKVETSLTVSMMDSGTKSISWMNYQLTIPDTDYKVSWAVTNAPTLER